LIFVQWFGTAPTIAHRGNRRKADGSAGPC
jgi:hypothetical protein